MTKMNSRIKRLSFLAMCSLTLVGVVAAFSASYRVDHYNAGTYSLTLDANNGKISGSYSTTVQENSTAKTSSGEPFSVSYYNSMTSSDSSFAYAQLKSNSGYLYSTYGVKGLISVDVTFKLSVASGSLYLYTSDSATFSSTQDQSLVSGTAVTVSKNYWKLFAQGAACYIDSIVLTYTCTSGSISSSSGSDSSSGTSSTTSSSTGTSVSSSGTTNSYSLVTSTSQLVSGSNYAIGSATSGSGFFASTAIGTKNIGQVAGTISNSAFVPNDTTLILTLGGSSGAWTFMTTNTVSASAGYLNSTSTTGENTLKTVSTLDKYAYFSISISSNAAIITCTGKSTRNIVRYNSGSSLFACYSSGQNAVYLYVQGSSSTSSSSSSSAGSSATSSASTGSSSTSSASTSSSSSAGYYKPTGDMTTPTFNYKKLNNTQDCDVLPTTGNLKVLVLPIELTDYPFSSQTLSDLGNAFNGVGSADTGYWESLASFYKKSSFGKLNLTYTIGAKFSSGYTAQSLYNKNSSDHSQGSSDILRLAVANYKSVTSSTCTSFDSDTNGLIDAVIMVYSCPDVQSSSAISNIDSGGDLFWAYCFWDYNNYANSSTTSPVACNYFWMSYDFLYEEAASPKVDAHTLIHESGHLMGLDDYYSYDTLTTASSVTPAPAGGIDMMDLNICDHDVFSKMALNWTKPYVVTGSCSITINPSEEGGDCILVPTSSGWNGTAFDEYLLMELYTPTNLNQLDAETKYSTRVQGYTNAGIKLYHVDSMVTKLASSTSGTYVTTPPTSFTAAGSSGYPVYTVAATNSRARDSSPATGNSFDLIRLIEAGKTNTFNTGAYGTNATLFKTGDTFTLGTYGNNFFPKKTAFNNGATLGFNISFTSVSSTSATITFTAA